MINSAALTAMHSAIDKNCYTEHYPVLAKRSGVIPHVRRWLGLSERGAEFVPKSESMGMCVASAFAGVQYYPEYWRQTQNPQKDFMWKDAQWEFHVPFSAVLTYEFITGLIDAMAMNAPEFAVKDVSMDKGIGTVCAEAISALNNG